jgi:cellobiose phosphorylase
VYGAPPHTGRGGWTWYTGSAGWLYRLGIEGILGLRPAPGGLEIRPCIPRRWAGYEATVRVSPRTRYRILVRNPQGISTGSVSIRMDGRQLDGSSIRLDDDGSTHEVEVTLLPGGDAAPVEPGRRELPRAAPVDVEAL